MNKMKFFTKCLVVLSLYLVMIPSLFAEEKYIVDDLSVYLRRGPGMQFGIVGSLKSGDKVSILNTSSDGKYSQIKDDKNRISWIETNLLSNIPSVKDQLPDLKQQIALLQEKDNNVNESRQALIDDYTNQLTIANQKITDLEKTNGELQNKTQEQQSSIDSLTSLLDKDEQSIMLMWFTRGGIVAGIGLIIGLLLPLLISRRRKKDRWMS